MHQEVSRGEVGVVHVKPVFPGRAGLESNTKGCYQIPNEYYHDNVTQGKTITSGAGLVARSLIVQSRKVP